MKYRKYTVMDRKEALFLFKLGYSPKKVSQELNIPIDTVKSWKTLFFRGRFDVYQSLENRMLKFRKKRFTYENKLHAINLLQSGMMISEVAQIFNCSVTAIYSWKRAFEEGKLLP